MTKPGGNRLSIAFAVAFASAVSAGMFFEFPWVALLPVVAIVAWWGMKRVDLFLAALFGVGGVARTVRNRGVGSAKR